MAEKSRYTIEGIYQGGYSSFKPSPNSRYFSVGSLGVTTDPRSANVLKEVSDKLSAGVKQIEIEAVTPDFFDQVAKQHLEETKRLAKLTGINISVHGPVIDTTGIDPRRGGYSESDRVLSEKKVIQTLERSHELNPDGNIPVNFHSAEGLPGSEFGPKEIDYQTIGPDGKVMGTKKGRDYKRLIVVNRESGKLAPLEPEVRFYPGGEVREETKNPQKMMQDLNSTEWDNSLFQVEVNRQKGERILNDIHPAFFVRYVDFQRQYQQGYSEENMDFSQEEKVEFNKIRSANEFVKQAQQTAQTFFSRAYEYAQKDGDEKKLKILENFSKEYGEIVGVDGGKVVNEDRYLNPKRHTEALQRLVDTLEHATPKMYVPIEEFALDQSSKTYGNAAFESYKKYGDKTPILNIENPPAGFALSTGEDLKKLVEKSREQFVKRAVENEEKWGSISEKAAERIAEKTIGATLDVGHMNMLRKYGYKEEDIIKESEKLAPVMKHLHLSDNFGFEHTELPMGMGNVPLKQIMEKLQKAGAKTEDMAKIIEASVWWTHFKTSPVYPSLELLGPKMSAAGNGPTWSQVAGLSQDYYGGFGMMLPSTNYETFGAGFSRLPAELGGAMPGAGGSRMSGRQME